MRTSDPDVRERFAGQIEIIAGGMFSGKSEELLRRLRRAIIARQKVQVFKPSADVRHRPERVVTRDLREVSAISVRDSRELRAALAADVQVVGIDEAQFFDHGLIDLATELADRGVRVIIAGLDQDFLRRPFGPMPALLCSPSSSTRCTRSASCAGAARALHAAHGGR